MALAARRMKIMRNEAPAMGSQEKGVWKCRMGSSHGSAITQISPLGCLLKKKSISYHFLKSQQVFLEKTISLAHLPGCSGTLCQACPQHLEWLLPHQGSLSHGNPCWEGWQRSLRPARQLRNTPVLCVELGWKNFL